MTTKHDNGPVAAQPVSTIAINTVTHHDLSIAQVIEQAIADTTKASPEQSLIEASLPGHSFNEGLSQLLGRLPDASASDPSKGGDHGSTSSNGFVSPADAFRASVVGSLDPTNQDPSNKGDLHDDWIRSGRPSEAELRAELGASGAGNGAIDSGTSTGASPGSGSAGSGASDAGSGRSGSLLDSFGHLQQPEQGSASPASDDPGHSMLEGMLSTKITSETGGKTERITDWTDSDGHEHHKVYEDYKDGSVIVTDVDKTTGVQTLYQRSENEDGSNVQETMTTYDPNTGQTKVWTHDSGSDHERTVVYDSNGKIVSDSDHPKAGGGSSIPDEDHQYVVPAGLNDLMKDDVKQMHQPSHDGDNVNVAGTEIPGTVARSDVAGPVGDDKARLLGGDRGFEGAQDGGGSGPGQTNYNGINGAIDFGPDHDETPQTSGREERNTQHAIHTDPGAAAHGGGNGSGSQQSSDQASAPIVIAVQEAARKIAETEAQKAADKLQDAVDHHDGPSQHEPIKPHESATADIGHGGGSHADAGGAFADLIRAAQNPLQSGLASLHQQAAPDPLQHLSLGMEIANHGFGPHAGEDVHAVSPHVGPLAALHDTHVDHHAAPVLDVGHIPHH